MSPTSYKVHESYTDAILPKAKFYISKYKYVNFINRDINRKQWVPAPGAYAHDKNTNMTKGLAKGWKWSDFLNRMP